MRAFFIVILTVILSVQGITAQRQIDIDDKTLNIQEVIYDGIDVSSYQRDIDWSATAKDKNIKFVYVKSTEGATYRSRHYAYNIENARKHGIKVGSYHFFRPQISVQRQFNNFTSIVKLEDQDLIPLIDVETKNGVTGAQLADSVLLFAQMLEKHYGCRPMIYTGSSFYNSYLRTKLSGYQLFIARYSKVEPRLAGGAKWTLWQFSERGRIAGIDHYVDLCRFNKGCSLRDILINPKRLRGSNVASDVRNVPPPRRNSKAKEEPQVPQPSKKELERQRKAKEKAEKEAKKKAEKEAKQKKEAERKLKKEQEAKRQKELKEEKLRLEHEKKYQEALEKQKKKQQEWEEQKRKAKEKEEAKKAEQERIAKQKQVSANQKRKQQGKRINQSSPDNDEL